jgi:D-alanyl-D-alanine carboxypeptidase
MTALKSAMLVAVAATLLVAAPATAARPDTLQGAVDAIHAAGATSVLAEVRTAAGHRSVQAGESVPFDAHYRIGSTSKTFTATVALQLVAEGRLALTDTVEREEWETTPGALYGLGISWRPVAGCARGVWSHGGTMPGYVTEAAVTATGDRAVAVSTATWSFDEGQAAREEATRTLVDGALCRR